MILKKLIAILVLFSINTIANAGDLEKITAIQEAKIADLEKRLVDLQKAEIEALKKKVESLETLAQSCKASIDSSWTNGSMCVLANGSCPAGFTKRSGHMRAISIYQNKDHPNSYLSPMNFGSSSIKWHGSPYQYGSWAGELNLVTCCK